MKSSLLTRQAVSKDALPMVALLNPIIAAGGTTAYETPFEEKQFDDLYIRTDTKISCVVAEIDDQIVGFQFLAWPLADSHPFPDGWAIIATFAKVGMTGLGIGSALFSATKKAATKAGVKTIDATIRADNVGGLKYYSRLGFTDYNTIENVPLKDGTLVDRIQKRFDL